MISEIIKNSFLLNQKQKDYLLENIEEKDENYKSFLLDILKSEKSYMIMLLREYKNKNTDVWMIKQELVYKNLKRIKQLQEEDDDEIFDIENELKNII